MGDTLSNTITGPIILDGTLYTSPFTNFGTIIAGGTEGVGAFPGVASTIAGAELTNNVSIASRNALTFLQSGLYGVEFTNGGTVINAGFINAYDAAIHITGGPGYVSNTGTLISYVLRPVTQIDNAVYLSSGGQIVNNGPTAYLTGAEITSASGTVTNENGATIAGPGVDLTAGGTIINTAAAIIQSGGAHIRGGPGLVTNGGTIASGGSNFGVALYSAGTVANTLATAVIKNGVYVEGGAGLILNAGSVLVGGVTLKQGGTVSNIGAGAYIGSGGVYVGYHGATAAVAGTVINQGTIHGFSSVLLLGGGLVVNAGTASFLPEGVDAQGTATVVNDGIIDDSGLGYETANGIVFADSIYLQAGGTISNSGTINGQVNFGGTVQNRLILSPNSTIVASDNLQGIPLVNAVIGSSSAANVIELQGNAGTLLGIGSHYISFSAIDLDAGAAWTISGDDAGLNGETINGFALGDTIDITGYRVLDDTFISGIGLVLQNGVSPKTIAVTGSFPNQYFTYSSDGNGGSRLNLTTIRPVYHTINYNPVSTISNAITYGVTLGSGNYTNGITITNTGGISNTTGYAVYAGPQTANGYVLNDGTVTSVSFNSAATFINEGYIGSNRNGGVKLSVTSGVGVLLNSGSIIAVDAVQVSGNAMITNTGLIRTSFRGNGVTLAGGTIGATFNNAGQVTGYRYGVIGTGNSTIINTGTIFANFNAVELEAGSTLVDYGLVNSPNDALLDEGGALIIEPGAVLSGNVFGGYGANPEHYGITFAGTTAGSLDLDGRVSFEDLANISLTPGALWTLEGGKGQIAGIAGQTPPGVVITGFAGGDTLVLDNAAYTGGYVSAAGVILTNATSSQVTFNLAGIVDNQEFTVTTQNNKTTIAGVFGALVSGGTTTTPAGSFANAPTVTSGGTELIAPGATAVDPTIAGGALVIDGGGSIDGGISFTGTGGSLVIADATNGAATVPMNVITGFTAGDTIELSGIPFSGTGTFGAPDADSYTVATAGTLTIDADGIDYTLLIAGATVGQDNFVLSDDLGITEQAASTDTLSTSISTGITLSTAGPDLSPFTVTSTGEISAGSGSTAVFSSLASPSLLNTGMISAGLDGVLFTDGGTVFNEGVVESSRAGIVLEASGAIMNTGKVIGESFGAGIILKAPGTIMNTGTVIGTEGNYAIAAEGGGAKINNTGLIQSTGTGGSGNYLGILFYSGTNDTAINSGIIDGTRTGLVADAGAYIDNLAGGTIIGGNGVLSGAGATVVNSGTIEGQGFGAVDFTSGFDNLLIVNPGAVFIDQVTGGDAVGASGSSELELGAGEGTLGSIGSQFTDFQTIAFGAGASWAISGDVAGLAAGQIITGFTIGDTIELVGVSFTGTGGTYGAAGEDTYTVATAGTLSIDADGADYNLLIAGVTVGQDNFVLGGDLTSPQQTVEIFEQTHTLSTSISTGITLSTAGPDLSPFTITPTGEISAGAGSSAVFSSLASPSLLNTGVISAGLDGVLFTDGGTIFNAGAPAEISGADGVVAIGGLATVQNSGTIHNGVSLLAGGDLGNSGLISAPDSLGVKLQGGGSILNTGTIFGYGAAGSYATKLSGPTYVVEAAVFAGSSGSVNITNPGLIETEGTFPTGGTLWAGIVLADTGSVENSGTIMSGYDVIDVFSSTSSYVKNSGLLLESASGTFAAGHGPGAGVIFKNAAGTAVNSGTIMASYGFFLDQGGFVENTRSGVIDASQGGIGDVGSGVTVLNNGVVESSGFGIYLAASGTIMNTGIVSGGSYGAMILAAPGTVMNTGTVIGTHGNYGILTEGGGIIIDNTGLIQSTGTGGSGNYLGIWFTSGTNNTAINSGIIDATRTGILAGAEAYIDNLAGGTIIGGVRSGVGATVVNSGTINGQGFRAVLFTSGYDNRLIVNPGAVFIDPVDGGDAVGATGSSELDLGAGQGSLGGLGSLFVDFQTIAFDAGAAWTLGGDEDGLAAGQVIDGFGLDDTLVLTGFAFTSASLVAGAGIQLGNGTEVETLALQGSLALNDFLITTDGANTTLVETIVSQPVAVSGAALTVGAGVTVQNPTLDGGTLVLASGASIIGNISITGTGSTLVIEPDSQGDTTVPGNEITGFTAGDTIELAGVSFTSSGGAFGTPGEDTYTVATAGTLSIDADGTDYKLLIAGAIVGQNDFVLRGDLEITEIGTSTVFITTATAYTLAPGSEISISSATPNDDNEAGEAIFTSFSSGSAGPAIIIDGTVIDNAESFSPDQYAIQSRATADATLTNDGTIIATNIFAVGFNNGTITNQAGSTISGAGGIKIGSGSLASTIINEGTILGSSQQGIDFLNQSAQGVITNASGGFIRGGASGGSLSESGIYISGGTVTNAGIIEQGGSAGFSIDFFGPTGGNELILDQGQVLKGVATASGSGNYIVLGGTGAGTLANPSNYHGFTLVSVATGADWQIGTSSSAVSITGVSTIDVAGTLNVLGSLTGTTINMEGNGAGSELVLTGSSSGIHFYNEVTDFGATDSIVITNFDLPSGEDIVYDYSNGTLSVSPEGVGLTDQFALSGPNGNLSNSDGVVTSGQLSGQFKFTTLSNGDLVISDMPCFAAGTRILTPNGEVAVEDLKAGDEVLTARESFEMIATIIWTGQRTIDLARHAMPEKVRPVRILAGGFAPGLPERDLMLSPDHALFIDGHLIEAKTLVNGVTVIVDKTIRHVTYHHIELARHDVVLAEGLPAETYLESGNRTMFESEAAPMVLHPDFVSLRREKACARLLVSGPAVTAARQRLLDRALALGFAITGDVDLVVKSGLERIWPSESDDGELLFVLPAKARQVQLLSGTGVPAEISADPDDRRVLGVAVTGLALIAGGVRHRIPLDDAAHEGFHEYEAGHRWTKGAARITLPPYSGRAVLEVAIHGQAARWSAAARRQLSG